MMELSVEAMASGTNEFEIFSETATNHIDTQRMTTFNLPSESPTEVQFFAFPNNLFNRLSSRDRKLCMKFPNLLPESADFNYILSILNLLAGIQNSLFSPIERSWAQELTMFLQNLDHGDKKSRQKTRSALWNKEDKLYK